ncbi:MAG: hypothetical protein ACRCZQ_02210 [Bacteroidales bacterium]
MKKSVEIEASEALLDIGVSVPFKDIRIPFRKNPVSVRLTMKRPCLGSQIRIARLYLQLGVTYEQMELFSKHQEMEFLAVHGKRISKMVALTIFRGAFSGLFAPLLAWILRWFVRDGYLQGANLRFISLLGTKAFMNIIRSAEQSNPMKARLSHKMKGS